MAEYDLSNYTPNLDLCPPLDGSDEEIVQWFMERPLSAYEKQERLVKALQHLEMHRSMKAEVA